METRGELREYLLDPRGNHIIAWKEVVSTNFKEPFAKVHLPRVINGNKYK